MDNYRATILGQYANSPVITGLIAYFNDWIDPGTDIDGFLENIWDIETANDYGLDIWGKIVDVSRYLTVTEEPAYLGFNEMSVDASGVDASGTPQPFGQAPMYVGATSTSTYKLATDAYRKLIMVKAMANITNCTAPSLNALLSYLFSESGRAYVTDTGEMMIRYVFEFTPSAVDLAIMLNSGAVPRPAGVQVSLMYLDSGGTFGFNGTGLKPFGEGTLFNSSDLQDAN